MKTVILGAALALLSVLPVVCQNNTAAAPEAIPGMFTYYTGDCYHFGISPTYQSCNSAGYCQTGRLAPGLVGVGVQTSSYCMFPVNNLAMAKTWAPAGEFAIDGTGYTQNLFWGYMTTQSFGFTTCSDFYSTGFQWGGC